MSLQNNLISENSIAFQNAEDRNAVANQVKAIITKEKRAEQEAVLQLPFAKTIQKSMSVAQTRDFSDFWPVFKAKHLPDTWEYYFDSEQIAVLFVQYIRETAAPKRALHGYSNDPAFVADCIVYIRLKINEAKLENGGYIDDRARFHGALSQASKDIQTATHEAVNRQLKYLKQKYKDWSFLTPEQFDHFMEQHRRMMQALPNQIVMAQINKLKEVSEAFKNV